MMGRRSGNGLWSSTQMGPSVRHRAAPIVPRQCPMDRCHSTALASLLQPNPKPTCLSFFLQPFWKSWKLSAASATGMHGAKEPLGKDPGLALRSSSEIGNADRCQSLQTAPVMEMQSDDNKWLLRNWRCRGQRAHPQHGSLPSPSAALPPANCSANCCELRWVRAFG